MKNRRPRKLKKIAKIRKAFADAALTAQAALITTMGMVQLALVNSQPPLYPMLKAFRIAEVTINTASAIQKCLSEIKPWQYYATRH
jgi:hypothetical protein